MLEAFGADRFWSEPLASCPKSPLPHRYSGAVAEASSMQDPSDLSCLQFKDDMNLKENRAIMMHLE